MRYSIIGAVLVLVIAGVVIVWVNDQGAVAPGEGADVATHLLVVELVAPITRKTARSITDDPVVAATKMVSVKVTLQFANEHARNKASGRTRQLRRGYASTVGIYLTNRAETATDDIEASIRERVAKATLEMFGAGVVTDFQVEGQFGGPTAE